ncbi:MAG: methyltransferase domain-containing protein, partial [Myxococcales bacterium]|nr:methyltransferase domain-containing protein [Myxococcales bacterium]
MGVVPIVDPETIEAIRDRDILIPPWGEDLLERLDMVGPAETGWDTIVTAGMYARSHYADPNPPFATLCDELLQKLPVPPTRVLDLGCSAGRMGIEVAMRTGASLTGVDLEPLPLRWAARAANTNPIDIPVLRNAKQFELQRVGSPTEQVLEAQWICANVYNLPLEAKQFDLICAINLLDSVPHPKALLAVMADMLSPGGAIIVAQPATWSAALTPPERWLLEEAEWENAFRRHGLRSHSYSKPIEWILRRTPTQWYGY